MPPPPSSPAPLRIGSGLDVSDAEVEEAPPPTTSRTSRSGSAPKAKRIASKGKGRASGGSTPAAKASGRGKNSSASGTGKKRQRPTEGESDSGMDGAGEGFMVDIGKGEDSVLSLGSVTREGPGAVSSSVPPRRWVVIGKSDEEANAPVVSCPVADEEFDEMVRSCVRNDALEKVKEQRAGLAKRLHVSLLLGRLVTPRRVRIASKRVSMGKRALNFGTVA